LPPHGMTGIMRSMKTVLCFGDSNTWGFVPESITAPCPARHAVRCALDRHSRRRTRPGFRVIEEGQNGRTTVHDDPFAQHAMANSVLPAILESHKPLDLVVLMLGTNDLKAVFGVSPGEIATGVKVLAQMILGSDAGIARSAAEAAAPLPARHRPATHLPDIAAKFPNAQKDSRNCPGTTKRSPPRSAALSSIRRRWSTAGKRRHPPRCGGTRTCSATRWLHGDEIPAV
jgi:lysophospholipase L1-like esterase